MSPHSATLSRSQQIPDDVGCSAPQSHRPVAYGGIAGGILCGGGEGVEWGQLKQLKKSDRRRFDELCAIIRKALHLDHLEREYLFEDDPDSRSVASTKIFSYGWRLLIYIRPIFWDEPFDKQLRYLIHEHVHVCLHPYHQATDRVQDEWICPHDKTQVIELLHTGAEISVDHLTEVFYRLLKDQF